MDKVDILDQWCKGKINHEEANKQLEKLENICPACGCEGKRIKTPRYPGEKWFKCTNPSCNRMVFKS